MINKININKIDVLANWLMIAFAPIGFALLSLLINVINLARSNLNKYVWISEIFLCNNLIK